jgi:hypothetical protein
MESEMRISDIVVVYLTAKIRHKRKQKFMRCLLYTHYKSKYIIEEREEEE